MAKKRVSKTKKKSSLLRRRNYDLGGDVSVIPAGVLHARKNKIEENTGMDNLGKKGIPVVYEENGKLEKHAEIEHKELILHKSIAEDVDTLVDTYNEEESDEVALELGMLIYNELKTNTLDHTGEVL